MLCMCVHGWLKGDKEERENVSVLLTSKINENGNESDTEKDEGDTNAFPGTSVRHMTVFL